MRLSARARVAALSAVLALVAAGGAAVPLLLEQREARETAAEERLAARLLGAAALLERPAQVEALVGPFGLSAAAVLGPLREVQAQAGTPGSLPELAARCPRSLLPGQPVQLGGGEPRAACVGLSGGSALLGVDAAALPGRRQAPGNLLLVLALASMAAGLSAAVVRQALSPLVGMAEAARRLAQGELGPGGPTGAIPDPEEEELRPLALALNQLATALQARQDEIQARLGLTRQLAALVAHEVRNPLQSLTMLADVVAYEDDPAARKALLESIRYELELIGQVVTRLVSDGDHLRLLRAPTPLGEVVRRCVTLHTPRAREAGVQLQAELGPPLLAQVDAALLRRALENLVQNALALRAAAGGGRVLVTLTPGPGPGEASLHVDDDGAGVPAAERQRIFLPGVSGRAGGTGLGLALARQVAEAHQGTLQVGESPLGGARFTLTLPLQPRQEPG